MLKVCPSNFFDTEENVDLNPNSIKDLDHILAIFKELDYYENKSGYEAAVGERVNIHLGGMYVVSSRKEIEESIKHPNGTQWYHNCYPRSYFETLKEKFTSKNYKNSIDISTLC